jgi:hypothetical protein
MNIIAKKENVRKNIYRNVANIEKIENMIRQGKTTTRN